MDMSRAMFLKGLPALHADVKALRQLTPGDQESIDPWHFGFPEDGTQELDDVLRECDEAMSNGDDLTKVGRRLLGGTLQHRRLYPGVAGHRVGRRE